MVISGGFFKSVHLLSECYLSSRETAVNKTKKALPLWGL